MAFKKNNNRGFSLIELIIVIAIMAVLLAVLAPRFVQYIERAKQAKIMKACDEVCHGIEILWVDPTNDYPTKIAGSKQFFINYGVSGGTQEDKLFEQYLFDNLKEILGDEMENYLGTVFINNGRVMAQKWKYLPEGKTKNYYYVYETNPIAGATGLTGPFYDTKWKNPN